MQYVYRTTMSAMIKLVKIILTCIYCGLFFKLLLNLCVEDEESFIEIKHLVNNQNTRRRIERGARRKENLTALMIKLSNYKQPSRLPTDLRYILKWTQAFSHYSSSIFRNGQIAFIDSNCSYINCFMTNNKDLLTDIRDFDAILFDVENDWDAYPLFRAPHQNYIFTASESASNYPMCDKIFDTMYNLTWTYKLDSDIRWSYVTIVDRSGQVVGPKINMSWINPMDPISRDFKVKLNKKKKAVAWFVSNCFSKSGRESVAKYLQKSLKKYGISIDIYGWCGNMTCPRDRIEECLKVLETDYYFYLAFENSLSEDYVTEKILYPLQYSTVPIVYGGANYSRFLPPGSYLDAVAQETDTIAAEINKAMKDRYVYYNYFRWHKYYKYTRVPPEADACVLCRILNESKEKINQVKNFRDWWNPKSRDHCNTNITSIHDIEKFKKF